VNITQQKGETVDSYVKRFREIYGTLKNLLGGEIFIDFLQKTPEWLAYDEKKNHNMTIQLEKESLEKDLNNKIKELEEQLDEN
jgi:hypothetical protein